MTGTFCHVIHSTAPADVGDSNTRFCDADDNALTDTSGSHSRCAFFTSQPAEHFATMRIEASSLATE